MQVIGLGSQDDFAYTQNFRSATGVTTPTMLWDPSFTTWRQLGITTNSQMVLFDPALGHVIDSWFGFNDTTKTEILAQAGV